MNPATGSSSPEEGGERSAEDEAGQEWAAPSPPLNGQLEVLQLPSQKRQVWGLGLHRCLGLWLYLS